MDSRSSRVTLIVIGVIAVIIGGVFAGQGADLIGGSSMTGDQKWLFIGLILVVIGIVLIVRGVWRRGGAPRA